MLASPQSTGRRGKMIAWLKRLFRRLFHLKEPSPVPIAKIEEMQWKSPRLFRRIRNFFRRAPTSYGFLNMPKFQPCEDCGRWAKRRNKTPDGATYRCRCALIFHVVHPLVRRQQLLGG